MAVSEFIGKSGQVEAERHSHERRSDDLLLWVHLREPIAGTVLSLLRRRLWELLHATIPRGGECEDWLVVIQSNGVKLATVSSATKHAEFEIGAGDA
ncbi:hypothetical protein ACPWT1_19855 [Ramlibacter sp. MMS24-I3-19]|uniref:hypothetical protein n=1 Tax=Ramlibacter sp. MMS24-I3-19 TaxID=3416606 RepID=UPI003D0290DE